MRDLKLSELFFICIIGCFVMGLLSGIIIGEYSEMIYINNKINESAQPNHILQNDHGFFVVQRYNESCIIIDYMQNLTILGEK